MATLDAALSEKGGDVRLAQLLSMIQPVRDEFRVPMAALRQGQQWMTEVIPRQARDRLLVIDIAHTLRVDAPLPELGTPRPSTRSDQGARVQEQLNRYLSDLQNQPDLSEWLMAFRQHLIDITARWGDDFAKRVCYDIAGVPPTNNALESRFGRLRRDQRRISGRQFNTATLLDEGPYLIWEC